MTAELPPYSIEVGMRPGLMVEILSMIEHRLKGRHKPHYYPWPRAQMLTRANANHIIFPLTRTPEREPYYDWAINVMQVDSVFITLDGRKLSLEEAKKLDLITVQQSTPFEEFLKKEGFINIVSSPQPAERHLLLLQKKRVEAWFTSRDLAQYALAENGLSEKATLSEPMESGQIYIAFSKQFPPSLRQQYIDVYNELKEDGSIAYIMKQYR
ncbi:transporter substrate-binding domain-containing protein [Terasakiella sp. A23]|uniref:substrate-binding periplasmic protein n=1 Tax=Terasakiella sp. FCG-A23 TaxID=3080561 RepID=UPI0029540DF4|nr:transporter substrate-binding domain-containing protein [Terasakiella sp. A23]MDV7341178.1 transporter substrate-binding domain-containing protein [Terasakiella sp. A23]